MSSIADKIMKRVRRHGRGVRVYTPKDFLDLVARSGTRAAVDQALARLARAGTLRRVGRGSRFGLARWVSPRQTSQASPQGGKRSPR